MWCGWGCSGGNGGWGSGNCGGCGGDVRWGVVIVVVLVGWLGRQKW